MRSCRGIGSMVNFLGRVVVTLVALVALITPGLCWSQEELDLFDLVEEIGENFYDLMQIDQVIYSQLFSTIG